jgi:hypothetical protein
MDVMPLNEKRVTKLMPVYFDAKIKGTKEKNMAVFPQIHTSNTVFQLDRATELWTPLVCHKCDRSYQNVLVFKILNINILVCL